MRNSFYPQLHEDAPQVPKGLRPLPQVEYGCGKSECRTCYEVIPAHVLRPADVEPRQKESL